jgi:eukaryotic-like serine/threonine-protein kinase
MTLDTSKPVLQTIGNYDLLEKIAEGGMGAIYKGRHRQTGQIVAIKIMPPHTAQNPVLVRRFEQEFRAASRLDHPNIVRALDYGEEPLDNDSPLGRSPYLVMEFVDGESLGQKLEREGAMGESEAIRLIAQVAQGLHRAHKQGLIHRDVKPDNILVTPDGQAKLADLGLVKEVETDLNLTRTGRGLGTPHFMAPEQFRNAKNANVLCDIYSLGATLYMMVTNDLPFKSNGPLDAWMKKMQNEIRAPRELKPTLSERVDWAIRRSMSADPQKRPSSCREFIEDLTGHSTKRIAASSIHAALADLWYLVYKDEEGQTHTVKGSTAAIRRSLKEGLIGDASNVRASKSKTGPFEPLRASPEFRDLIIEPTALSPTSPAAGGAGDSTPTSGPSRLGSGDNAAEEALGRSGSAGGKANPDAGDSQNPPHIDLDDVASNPSPQSLEWLKWLLVLIVALGSAAVAFFLLQRM